jgi:hypothetical protein
MSREIGIVDQVNPLLPTDSQNLIVNINFVACFQFLYADVHMSHHLLPQLQRIPYNINTCALPSSCDFCEIK